MNELATQPRAAVDSRSSYVDWHAILAGAVAASAISFLLMTFGTALGLSSTSPWSGLSARGMMIWAAIWIVLVQAGSFGAGGYIAGRMRMRVPGTSQSEVEFRDGVHGFLVWAVGVLIGAIVLASAASAVTRAAGQAAGTVAGAAVSSASDALPSVTTAVDYSIDQLLRPAEGPGRTAPADARPEDVRAGISRVLASVVRTGELTPVDKNYLSQIVAARSGLDQAAADKRVDGAVAQVRNKAADLERQAKEAANKARRATLLAGFLAAASLLVSCAVAAMAAGLGGKHRDEETPLRLFETERFW